jgi:hypothetical protein
LFEQALEICLKAAIMADQESAGGLGQILLKNSLITEDELAEANRRRRIEDKTLGRVLVEMGVLEEQKKMSALKQMLGHEIVSLEDFEIDPQVLGLLPKSFCERHMAVPILREGNAIVLAMEDPSDIVAVDEARDLAGLEVRPVITTCKDILNSIAQYPRRDEQGRIVGLEGEEESDKFINQAIYFSTHFLLAILPIPVFFYFLRGSQDLQKFVTGMDTFERVLFLVLCWGVWAVTLYEIDGLVFGRFRKPKAIS